VPGATATEDPESCVRRSPNGWPATRPTRPLKTLPDSTVQSGHDSLGPPVEDGALLMKDEHSAVFAASDRASHCSNGVVDI
jgi:hypothetical protein